MRGRRGQGQITVAGMGGWALCCLSKNLRTDTQVRAADKETQHPALETEAGNQHGLSPGEHKSLSPGGQGQLP